MQNYKITQFTKLYNNTNNKRSINWCKLFGMNMQRMSKNSSNVLKCLYNFKLRNAASESRSVSVQWWRQSCSRVCTCDGFAQMQRSRLSEGRGVNSCWWVGPWRMKVALSLHLAVDRCLLWVVSCTRFATFQIVPPDAEPSSLPPWSRDALHRTAVECPGDICVQVSHPQLPQETEVLMDFPNKSCGVVPGDGIGEMYR